jgi:hypothetical protein
MVFNVTFSYFAGIRFIDGGNQRKPLTYRKSPTISTTYKPCAFSIHYKYEGVVIVVIVW